MQASVNFKCVQQPSLRPHNSPALCHLSVARQACSKVSTISTVNAHDACHTTASARRAVAAKAYDGSGIAPSVSPLDRTVAAATYLLPFLNSFVYGRFILYQVPALRQFFAPALPLLDWYTGITYAPIIFFFVIYLGVVNNQSFRRFVRGNAMQAILIDIWMLLPRLIEMVAAPPTSGPGLQLYVNFQSFVFILVAAWSLYAIFSVVVGRWPHIPYISERAGPQIP